MRLVDGWHKILFRAWSARLMYLSFVFQVLEAALPYYEDILPIPPIAFRLLTLVVLIGAVWARVTPQPKTLPEKHRAHQQDQVEQPRKDRHRRSAYRRFCCWLARL